MVHIFHLIKKNHLWPLNCLQEALLNPNGITLASRKLKIIPIWAPTLIFVKDIPHFCL
jgi:hypothetical protein